MTPLVEELVPVPDPALCCELMEGLPYRIFLDSAATGTRLGRYSFVTADPWAVVHSKDSRTEIVEMVAGGAPTKKPVEGDALETVRAMLAPHTATAVPGLPPFQGGAAGYLAYDWGHALEQVALPRYDDVGMDDVVLAMYDWVLAWDHETARAWLVSTGMPETAEVSRERRAAERASWVRARLRVASGVVASGAVGAGFPPPPKASARLAKARTARDGGSRPAGRLKAAPTSAPPSYPVEGGWWDPRIALRSSFTRDGYLAGVERVREYIFAGDIFQTNLSQRFETPLAEPPWSLYRRLRSQNRAPFAAFIELPEAVVLSASPERFLRMTATGDVETRPIKGTRPRGLGPEHDAALGQALTESTKDRAENLMIVDLMRNDLSRVCEPGTVRVPELFALERYATVHHLVSTVVGHLAPGTDAVDLLRAAFPGGSITGAPKIRAMEIIAELEPSRRGVYCGSVGYWSVTGELDTSIAIRTAVVRDGRVYFSAGGGIVADSNPRLEYLETLDKARGIIDALAVPV